MVTLGHKHGLTSVLHTSMSLSLNCKGQGSVQWPALLFPEPTLYLILSLSLVPTLMGFSESALFQAAEIFIMGKCITGHGDSCL